jgi:hypothetical protein
MTSKLSQDQLIDIADMLDKDEDLRLLCLCSKYLNSVLQPRLFRRMEFVGIKLPGHRYENSITFRAFRQLLERSPGLADHPRDIKIRLGGFDMGDMTHVLEALTGKGVVFVELPENEYGWECVELRTALEKLFHGTKILLTVSLHGLQGLSPSCLASAEHVILYDCVINSSADKSVVCKAKTISMARRGRRVSLGGLLSASLLYLTHLMLDWEPPSGNLPGEWYVEIGMALANMPKLELLTVQYRGTGVYSCLVSSRD